MSEAQEGSNLVLDTNVFVAAAFNPASASAEIVSGLRSGRWHLAWSRTTLAETRAVISAIPGLSWQPFSVLFEPRGEYPDPADTKAYSCVTDPADRHFAALAAAACTVLITSDHHLLSVRDRLDIEVSKPTEFIARHAE